MKKYLFFILILFPVGAFSNDLQTINSRLERQEKLCIGNWCLVHWKGGLCSGEVININEDKAKVKIFDTELPVSEWPVVDFYWNEIFRHTFEKTSTLDDLIASLKIKNILRTPFIEEGFRSIDRACFCPKYPYFDVAIDIGCEMCISTPHIHVFYLELSKNHISKAKRILDVGTGSGYMAAILSYLAPRAEVIGIDYYKDLIEVAKTNCQKALPSEAFERIKFTVGDGEKYQDQGEGFDIIYVGFMCDKIPPSLIEQLRPNGVLLIPIKKGFSSYDDRLFWGRLLMVEKENDGEIKTQEVFICSFIPSQSKA